MKPERWRQIEDLYHRALECAPDERTAFLDKGCDGDHTLRQEVESLLAFDERAQDFITTPPYAIAAEMLTERPQLLIGSDLNHYQILSHLGRGGMGEVYLAADTRLGRKVAIKLLPSEFTRDAGRVKRFKQEARAASALNHPNILTIHEIGESDHRHFIVSEYVEGHTLRQPMMNGPMLPATALEIAVQVASALDAAHAAGIVHRDIKPENIMVRPDGLVKALDFGLAKLTERQSAAADTRRHTASQVSTEAGVVMGTISYMSPEQARGLSVDARTDIWSLGVLLYEMLSGRPPFTGETATDLLVAIVEKEPEPLTSLAIGATPAELDRIITKTIRKDRAERYQTSRELLGDLQRLQQHLEIESHLGRSVRPETNGTIVAKTDERATSLWTTRLPGAFSARRAVIVIAIVTVLFLSAIAYVWRDREIPVTSRTEIKSLAVLPFKSLSQEAGDDYLGLGIADAIITRTSQMRSLVVRPISAVRRYQDHEVDPLEAGRQLQVDAVLDGSVQRVGDQLRVSLLLLKVQDGTSLWADAFDREKKHAFALQDDISSNVVRVLHLTLTAGEEKQLAKPPTENAESYDYYLRGRYYMAKGGRENLETALTMFERATALDPYFALAHADIAQAYQLLFFGIDADRKYEEKAYVALEKALALDPNLAEAYVLRANMIWTLPNGFPHERAYQEHQRALAINPNLAIAYRSEAALIIHLGFFDKALDNLQTALRLDPNDREVPPRIARIYWYQQKYELALAEYEKANHPSYAWEKGLTLWHLGRKEEAVAVVEKGLKQASDENRINQYDLHAAYAVMMADAGKRKEAEQYIRIAIEDGQGLSHFHHAAFSIACAYALMGEKQSALQWLEKTAEQGMPCYPLFDTEPALSNLRSDPQFKTFMEKLKKQWEGYVAMLQ